MLGFRFYSLGCTRLWDLGLRVEGFRDDESTLPHLPFGCFWLRLKKERKKISNRMKKISYEPRRNLLEPQTGKNLLRKWSCFCKNIL